MPKMWKNASKISKFVIFNYCLNFSLGLALMDIFLLTSIYHQYRKMFMLLPQYIFQNCCNTLLLKLLFHKYFNLVIVPVNIDSQMFTCFNKFD